MAAVLPVGSDLSGAMNRFLKTILEKDIVDAVLMPMKVPSGDSFAWIIMSDSSIVDDAEAMAPVMPVQGARALRSLTRKGEGSIRVLALMRPCEIRAAIELSKLGQVKTENLILAAYDCPGAVPMDSFVSDPSSGEDLFRKMLAGEDVSAGEVKPSCTSCVEFSMTDADLHFGHFGLGGTEVLLIPGSPKGMEILEALELPADRETSIWDEAVRKRREKQVASRDAAFEETGENIRGVQGMLNVFADCISCRNCRAACPICYCRLCHFESETAKQDPNSRLDSAVTRGGISLPADRMLFHTGRMTHMSLSCVSCGQCSDACPADIPVAQVFSFVADRTQKAFEYSAGRNDGDPLPLRSFMKSELSGIHEMVSDAEPGGHAHE